MPSHVRPDEASVRRDLVSLYSKGYNSLAIVFVHSYTYPDHELFVGRIAREIGFQQVSISSQLIPMIKMVPRGVSSTADAYLTPILMEYLDGFFKGFDDMLRRGSGKEAKDEREAGTRQGDEGLHDPRVEFMGSDGGLLDLDNFSGLKSILSGPAGGVVGYALTSWDEERRQPVIGWVITSCYLYCSWTWP
jgi:5-oxoprolinase (ATP-hydrolysing)